MGKLIRFMLLPLALYYRFFVLVFWQPVIWNLIKPSNGIIDNKAHWFHRHSVTCLNKVRNNDGWVMMSLLGLKVRDPHSHISRESYRWSKRHLFVTSK